MRGSVLFVVCWCKTDVLKTNAVGLRASVGGDSPSAEPLCGEVSRSEFRRKCKAFSTPTKGLSKRPRNNSPGTLLLTPNYVAPRYSKLASLRPKAVGTKCLLARSASVVIVSRKSKSARRALEQLRCDDFLSPYGAQWLLMPNAHFVGLEVLRTDCIGLKNLFFKYKFDLRDW